jgi:hypothetical protein
MPFLYIIFRDVYQLHFSKMSSDLIKQNILKKKEEKKRKLDQDDSSDKILIESSNDSKKRKLDQEDKLNLTETRKIISVKRKSKKQKLDISYTPEIYCPWKIIELKKEYLLLENDKQEQYGYPMIQRLRKRLRQNSKIPCLVITKKDFPYLRQKIDNYLKLNSELSKHTRIVIYKMSDIETVEANYQSKLQKLLSEANE